MFTNNKESWSAKANQVCPYSKSLALPFEIFHVISLVRIHPGFEMPFERNPGRVSMYTHIMSYSESNEVLLAPRQ